MCPNLLEFFSISSLKNINNEVGRKMQTANSSYVFTYHKSDIFKRFILSYLIIFIIPLLLTWTFVHNNVLDSLSTEITNSTIDNIIRAKDTIDINLQGINHIAARVPKNQNIIPMLYTQDANNLSQYQFYLLMRELKNYRASNAFMDNIFVYFRDSEIIVGADGKYTLDIFYNHVYRYSNMFQEDFRYKLNTVNSYTYVPVEKVYDFSSYRELITYLVPIPITNNRYNTTLMITIDASTINKTLLNVIGSYEGAVYAFNAKGDIISIVENKSINIDSDEVLQFLTEEDSPIINDKIIHGQKHIILSTKSDKTGWGYVAILPWDQVLLKVNDIRVRAVWLISILILIGVILAYYFSYKNYYPIRSIIDFLWEFGDESPDNNDLNLHKQFKNDFDVIGDILSQLVDKNTYMEKRITSQLPVVRADFLISLLKGEYTDEDSIRNMAEFVQLNIPLIGPFCVVIFNIDDYDEFEFENSKPTQSAYRFAIANVAEELSQNIGKGYAVEMEDDKIALLIDFGDKERQHNAGLIDLGQKVINFFCESFPFTLTIGVGGIYDLLIDIPKSFIESNLAIDYKIIKGKNTVISYNEIDAHKQNRDFYPAKNRDSILTCLNKGDFEGINQVLGTTIENLIKSHADIDIAKCVYFEIINTAMKALTELEPKDYSEILLHNKILSDMLRCETLDEVCDQTMGFYKTVCDNIQAKQKLEDVNFRDIVIQYIKEHYCDNNLTLTIIAEEFGVTPSYLSRFFKEHIRCNFVEYLHQLRLKKAKQLLLNTDANIHDISVECGYSGSHGLIRAFKRYENITPGRFRENMRSLK